MGDIGTFGGLMTFCVAAERAGQARHAADPALAQVYARRVQAIERLRRENVNEMILEPLEGVTSVDLAAAPDAAAFEERLAAFYEQAALAAAPVLAEVGSRFRQLAKQNREQARALRAGG